MDRIGEDLLACSMLNLFFGDEGVYEMGASLVYLMVWDGDYVHVLSCLRVLCRCEGRILKYLLLENSEISHRTTLFIKQKRGFPQKQTSEPTHLCNLPPPPPPKNQRAALVE